MYSPNERSESPKYKEIPSAFGFSFFLFSQNILPKMKRKLTPSQQQPSSHYSNTMTSTPNSPTSVMTFINDIKNEITRLKQEREEYYRRYYLNNSVFNTYPRERQEEIITNLRNMKREIIQLMELSNPNMLRIGNVGRLVSR